MKQFYEIVVKNRKLILLVFVIATLICLFAKNLVAVNYDINDYLPEDSSSTISINKMEEEFDGGIPNARILIHDVTIPEALNYKQKLQDIDGIDEVTWLDDTVDITEPIETINKDTIETYYKDNNALLTVTINEDKRINAVAAIRDLIGDDNALTGSAVSTADATTNTVIEVNKVAIIAVIFVFLVLLLTTNSWIEPIIVLIGLGVAIAINTGTNLIFGEISFVTNAAGNVLQLAVSLDYSVFLIHRFEECRRTINNPEDAMVDALCKSTSSILSSGLTTVIGFLALIIMQFKIGPDLGLSLAKGVAISLITVFIFMPALILSTYKLLDRTRHKSLMPSFKKFSKVVRYLSIPIVCLFLLVITPAYLASNSNDYYYGTSHIFGPETLVGRDTEDIKNTFGDKDTYVLMVPENNEAEEIELSDALKEIPNVTSITSFVDTVGAEIPPEYLDSETLSQLESGNYSRMVISVDVPYEGEDTFNLIREIRNVAQEYYPNNYYLAGEGVSTYDLMNTVTNDMVKVNYVAIGAVLIVLIFSFKSLVLPIILVLCIEAAIWINLSVPYFMDTTCFYIAYLIISSIQLGATVDYAILMTDRYRENRIQLNKKQAIEQTISDVTVSILTSGSVLTVVGLLMGHFSSNQLLAQIGTFIGRGAIFSLIIVMFVLPGVLFIFDSFVTGKVKTKFKIKKSWRLSNDQI